MMVDPQIESFIQKTGAELEAAFRESGTLLPQGVSGEILVRALLEDMQREAHSPEGLSRARRISEILREVAAELPGGLEHPDFIDRVHARMEDLLRPDDPGPAASA